MSSRPIKQQDWINHAKQINDEIRKQFNLSSYDYSKVNYNKQRDKITIICHEKDENGIEHGEFYPIASLHYQGRWGCKKCGLKTKQIKTSISYEEFIKRSKEIHNNLRDNENLPRYDYSLIKPENIINVYSTVKLYCPIHGIFDVTINCNLHYKVGCQKCSLLKKTKNSYKTLEEFIKEAQEVHKKLNGTPKYDYSKTIYTHSENPINIICHEKDENGIEHGEFIIKYANSHLNGAGCPKCNKSSIISKEELELQNFLKINLELIGILFNNREILKPNELDIYIPDKKLAIEFNGLYWHSELSKPNNYHIEKTEACEKQGIQLIHIFEDEWLEKQEIVKSRLLNILGKSKWKLYARNLKIKQVPVSLEKYFFNRNHLQGYIPSQLCYGLFWLHEGKEYLVSAMSFGDLRKNLGSTYKFKTYEMYRFCNALNYSIPGAAQKLFKHFLKQINPNKVISYADRRWSTNNKHNLYNQLGFEFICNTKIGYDYVYGTKRINRFNLRKNNLQKYVKDNNQEFTEKELAYKLGYYRIYNCGQLKYEYLNNSK